MLSLEQVKLLEKKVEHAIAIIKKLNKECDTLKLRLIEKDERISELESMVITFKDDQTKIETGIKNTLSLLDSLEDLATLPNKQEGEKRPASTSSAQEAQSQKQKDLAQILGKPSPSKQDKQSDIF
ncbi:MAG: cell division protein ZapB [Treponemataceae bacterium]